MTAPADAERIARAALTWVAEPGDPVMGALLRICSPSEIVAALIEGRTPRVSEVPPGGIRPGESGAASAQAPHGRGGHARTASTRAAFGVGGSQDPAGNIGGGDPTIGGGGGPVAGGSSGPVVRGGGGPMAGGNGGPVVGGGGDGGVVGRSGPDDGGGWVPARESHQTAPGGYVAGRGPAQSSRQTAPEDRGGGWGPARSSRGVPGGSGRGRDPAWRIGGGGSPVAGAGPGGNGALWEGGVGLSAIPRLEQALRRWSARLGEVPPETELDAWWRDGIRLVIPGDVEWPSQLDVLGDARPWALWVRGQADLRYACLRSVSVVGTRAATPYGTHVCGELAVSLADKGWTIVSGGAFGIDGYAHRGAIAVAGTTIAVLPCGVDRAYPQAHAGLFRSIRKLGAVVSELPPGRMPTKPGFLVRNRVIAALSRGTVVVEAALRSGALNTARHAYTQGRPLMAVPGPVTSAQSAGCHEAIREWGAVCVTSARDVMELLEFADDEPADGERGPALARDLLGPEDTKVLEAVPARMGWGPARIAIAAGVDFDTVMRCLGGLAAAGFVERCDRGWRLRRPSRQLQRPPKPESPRPESPRLAGPCPERPQTDGYGRRARR